MLRKTILTAAILGMLAVILGAFGAHGLTKIVSEKSMSIWNKGVLYHFIHTFAIVIVGLLSKQYPHKTLNYSFYLFLLGIIFFSGSIYFLTFGEKLEWVKYLGPITPMGGMMFIGGWFSLFMYALKYKDDGK